MNQTIIVHHNDPDGYASAAIAYDKLSHIKQPIELMEYSYEKDPDTIINKVDKDTKIVMVDVSFKMPKMEELIKKAGPVVWIDHHKSAIKDFKDYDLKGLADTRLVDGTAACVLTWQYFHADLLNFSNVEEVPEIVKLIGMYDVWDNKDAAQWERAIKAMYGLKAYKDYSIPTSKIWTKILMNDSDINENIIDRGQIAKQYQDNLNVETLKKTVFETELETKIKEGHLTNVRKYKCVCCNNTFSNSMVFDAIDTDKYDIMISYYQNSSKTFTISFYSTKKDVDCSVIAKSYEGGGHRGASGCQQKELMFEVTDKKPVWK